MAKSLRSKRRRQMRAIKRVRYGAKELERLKKTLANDTTPTKTELDEVMTDISEIATVSDAKTVTTRSKTKKTTSTEGEDSTKHEHDEKTMKNKFGSYPVWMHQREIRKRTKAFRKDKKAKTNKRKSKK